MYSAWLLELDKEAEMATQARKEMEQARQNFQLAELDHKTQVTKAETDKQVEKLKGECFRPRRTAYSPSFDGRLGGGGISL